MAAGNGRCPKVANGDQGGQLKIHGHLGTLGSIPPFWWPSSKGAIETAVFYQECEGGHVLDVGHLGMTGVVSGSPRFSIQRHCCLRAAAIHIEAIDTDTVVKTVAGDKGPFWGEDRTSLGGHRRVRNAPQAGSCAEQVGHHRTKTSSYIDCA
jgi:hypothetical protein